MWFLLKCLHQARCGGAHLLWPQLLRRLRQKDKSEANLCSKERVSKKKSLNYSIFSFYYAKISKAMLINSGD